MESKFENIGKKIRDLRLSRSMTQKELATGSVTRNMLSLIENGNALPSLPTLAELAGRLGISVGYFFAETDEETAAFTKMSRHYIVNSEIRKKLGLSEQKTNLDKYIQQLLDSDSYSG